MNRPSDKTLKRELGILRSRLVALRQSFIADTLAADDMFGPDYDGLLAADIAAIDRLLTGLGGRGPKNEVA